MSPEHKNWALRISKNIPDISIVFSKSPGPDANSAAMRTEKLKDIQTREEELVAFFMAPSEPIEFGEFKGRPCRRELFKHFLADREQKAIASVFSIAGSAAAATGSVVVAAFAHRNGVHFPYAVGEIVPAVKALGAYAALAGSAGIAVKTALAKNLAKFADAATEFGSLQRLADDPPLACPSAKLTALLAPADLDKEDSVRRFEQLAVKTPPADRIELMALNEKSTLKALDALHRWRTSVSHLDAGRVLTLFEAVKILKKSIANAQQNPDWANSDFKALREILNDKESIRSAKSIGISAWAKWKIVQAISRDNPLASISNASIQLFGLDLYRNATRSFADRLLNRRATMDALLSPSPKDELSDKTWISPPRRHDF